MTQSQPVTRIFRESTPTLIAAVVAAGLLASASRGHAQATMIWTNGSGFWNSTTAWQTNLLIAYTNDYTGGVTNHVTNSVCVVAVPSPSTNTVIVGNCPGGLAVPPSTSDAANFTNSTNPNITISGATSVRSLEVFSNAVVTIGISASTLSVTSTFRVAQSPNSTATVYWAGGTLAVTNNTPGDAGAGVVQIGTGSNSVGTLVVTNGTVLFDPNSGPGGSSVGRGLFVGGPMSRGTLVIAGPAVVTNRIGGSATLTLEAGSSTGNSQLIITNGGKLFMSGTTLALSNSLVVVSDPGSVMSNADGIAGSGAATIGSASAATPGVGHCIMIVSNGATVWNQGTIAIGRSGSASNTGIVVGAGSRLITFYSLIGGTAGANSNDLVVYDGGFFSSAGGTLSVGGSATCADNAFHMGGVGATSTGLVTFIKYNSGALRSSIVVTNAVLATGGMDVIGSLGNCTLNVLSKGTLLFSNQTAVTPTTTNVLSINNPSGALTINAGTVSAVSGSNVISIAIGTVSSGVAYPGNTMTIANGGKLLTEFGTIGASDSYNTGIVTGVGSVWSNFTAGASYNNSNTIAVGGGTQFNNNNNYLAVLDGASLVNNGSLNIGNTGSSTLNSVVFGGPGAPAVITNSGEVNIGNGLGTSGNSLTISNATLSCDSLNVAAGTNRINNSLAFYGGTILANFVKVHASNTFVFTAGTLNTGGMDTDPGANNSNEFVVGDGISAAYYDMSTNVTGSGTGFHSFGSPGFVVTNNAFLRGSGTLTGTTTVDGTFVPGFANSVGWVYTSNSLTFGSSAVLNYDLGTLSDTATINGNLALGGATINVTDSGGFGAGTYVLFTHTNTVSGTLNLGTYPGGFLAVVSNDMPNTPRILLVVTSIAPPDPYTAWATHYFPGGGASAAGTADPDHDGVSNTNEFLAGFNPTNSAAYPHIIAIARQGSDMNVTYLGANGDNTYTGGPASRSNVLEFTTGTASGNYSNNFVSTGKTNILSGGTGVGVITNMVDTGGAIGTTRYYRIRVLAP